MTQEQCIEGEKGLEQNTITNNNNEITWQAEKEFTKETKEGPQGLKENQESVATLNQRKNISRSRHN